MMQMKQNKHLELPKTSGALVVNDTVYMNLNVVKYVVVPDSKQIFVSTLNVGNVFRFQ